MGSSGSHQISETEKSMKSFMKAVKTGKSQTVQDLLSKGAIENINTCNSDGLNALHIAARCGYVEIIHELLSRGALPDFPSKNGFTALHMAALAGKLDVLETLIRAGADRNIQSSEGFSPLYLAAQVGHVTCVDSLLKSGAIASLATKDGFTPLAVATQQKQFQVVALLTDADSRYHNSLGENATNMCRMDNQKKLSE